MALAARYDALAATMQTGLAELRAAQQEVVTARRLQDVRLWNDFLDHRDELAVEEAGQGRGKAKKKGCRGECDGKKRPCDGCGHIFICGCVPLCRDCGGHAGPGGESSGETPVETSAGEPPTETGTQDGVSEPTEDGVAATAEPDAVLDDEGERSPREPTLDDLLSEQHWDFVRHVLNDSRAPEVRQVASAMGVRVQRAPAKADTPDVTTRQRDEKEQ